MHLLWIVPTPRFLQWADTPKIPNASSIGCKGGPLWPALKVLGPHGKEKRWPLGTESSPRLTVSKEVGSSVLQPQGTESGQHLERVGVCSSLGSQSKKKQLTLTLRDPPLPHQKTHPQHARLLTHGTRRWQIVWSHWLCTNLLHDSDSESTGFVGYFRPTDPTTSSSRSSQT